ncbi:hypothetical protein SPH9361_03997 [Sphingobium sp. CECT 9361]|nr:hypothetical protein SPH9361_03997 [Sphingobium sp. CECT 9361]
MTTMTYDIVKIAALNDRCRQGLDRNARIVVTRTCLGRLARGEGRTLEIIAQAKLMAAVRSYQFRTEDGPERDRGEFTVGAEIVRFKIDYYDVALEYGSEDPANAAITTRVMTIMLPEDD